MCLGQIYTFVKFNTKSFLSGEALSALTWGGCLVVGFVNSLSDQLTGLKVNEVTGFILFFFFFYYRQGF